MKISKNEKGNVLIRDKDGNLLHLVSCSVFLHRHSIEEDVILISKEASSQKTRDAISIDSTEVTEVEEKAFSGDRNALFELLSELFNCGGGNGSGVAQDLKSTSFNIGANSTVDTKILSKDFRFVIIEVPKDLEFIPTTGSVNPDNTSTNGEALYNKNYTDLCYNNFSLGTVNKPLPAINLGATKQVDSVSIWWWNSIYTAVEYKIQGSNDAQNWTDLATNLSSSVAERQDIPVNAKVQYIRMFCVQGRNSTFVVVSEMEAYAIPSEKDKYINHADDKASILIGSDDTIVIRNNINKSIDSILKHV